MPGRGQAQRDLSIEQAFGRVLRALREKVGISQERLGLDIDSGRTYISQLERAQKGPSLKMVFRLAPRLDTTATDIVRRVEEVLKKPSTRRPHSAG